MHDVVAERDFGAQRPWRTFASLGPLNRLVGRGRFATVVAPLAIIAAAGAALADAAPTGTIGWDQILNGLLAALFVVAVAASPGWVAIVVATIAAAFLGNSVWLVAAALALLLAIGDAILPNRTGWMPAASAALTIQGLLRLSPIGFFGLPSLIAGAAIALALGFGYRAANDDIRRIARITAVTLAVITAIITLVGGLIMVTARSDVERGISAARAGLSAARGGDPVGVVAELEEAAQALTDAEQRTGGIFTQPLRLVPIAAQHRTAIAVATREGSTIARQASRATINADIESISMSAGAVDLSALSAMEPDLAITADLLESGIRRLAAAQTPWLVAPVASRMTELTDEMRSVLPEARVAADAARVVPGLLGQDSPRRYFVAFGSPAESRELGGFIGSWALLEFDAGRVHQIEAGRISDLYDLARSNAPLTTVDDLPWYVDGARPARWPQNITASPQLSVVAAASRDLFAGLGGGTIDGFVYIDGFALGAMLDLTGPIQIEGVEQPVHVGNADQFFFDEQYRLTNREELKTELDDVFGAVFTSLLDAQLPGPERLGRVLGPVARQGRLQVATFDDDENAFLRSVKLQRNFGAPLRTVDSVAVVQWNGSVSKLDLYLHRDITYDVTVDDSGALTGSVTVELSSDVPADAPEYALGTNTPGVNTVHLSLYTPHELTSISRDGEPGRMRSFDEFGYHRYEIFVEIEANTSRTVQFKLAGQVDPDRPYDLAMWHQPLVNNDTVHIRYNTDAETSIIRDFELVENTVIAYED